MNITWTNICFLIYGWAQKKKDEGFVYNQSLNKNELLIKLHWHFCYSQQIMLLKGTL